MIADLLNHANLTLKEAGKLCGVTPYTIANWRDGKTRIPAEALQILKNATKKTITTNPKNLTEYICELKNTQNEQKENIDRLEKELNERKEELLQTTYKLLNAISDYNKRLERIKNKKTIEGLSNKIITKAKDQKKRNKNLYLSDCVNDEYLSIKDENNLPIIPELASLKTNDLNVINNIITLALSTHLTK